MKTWKQGIICVLVILALTLAFTMCKDEPDPAHTHTWGAWVTTPATVTDNGIDKITCTVCGAVKETKFSGEYATGTAGLKYTLITTGDYASTYQVSSGTFDGAVVHIPAYHRETTDDDYIPITVISGFGSMNPATPNTTLTTVTFTEGSQLKIIDEIAFIMCTSLASITIPTSVTTIDFWAFYGCTSLTSITIPASVTTIGGNAFQVCTNLTSITVVAQNQHYASEGGILYDKAMTTLLQGVGGNVAIPDSVTTFGNSAFDGCTRLTSITIPNSVTTIGRYVFRNCTSLTSITIPVSVTSLGNQAFDSWTNTQTVNVPFANAEAKPEGWETDWNKQYENGAYVDIVAIIKYWNGATWE